MILRTKKNEVNFFCSFLGNLLSRSQRSFSWVSSGKSNKKQNSFFLFDPAFILKPKTSMQKQKQTRKRETDFSRIWQKEKTILSWVSQIDVIWFPDWCYFALSNFKCNKIYIKANWSKKVSCKSIFYNFLKRFKEKY